MSPGDRTPVLDHPRHTDQHPTAPTRDDSRNRALEAIRRAAERAHFMTRLTDDGQARIWEPGKIGHALVVDFQHVDMGEHATPRKQWHYTLPGNPTWLPYTVQAMEHAEQALTAAYHQLNTPTTPDDNQPEDRPRDDRDDEDTWDD